MLEMTQPLVEAASRDDPASFVHAAHEQMKGNSLRDHALDLVKQGRTTVAEVMSITSQLED